MAIDAVHNRIPIKRPPHDGADVADAIAIQPTSFIGESGNTKVSAIALECEFATRFLRPQANAIFECTEQAITNATDLPGDFRGAKQIGEPALFGIADGYAFGQVGRTVGQCDARRAADSPRVYQRCRFADKVLHGLPRATPTLATAAHCRARRGDEHFLTFQKEQTLVGEKSFKCSEVDDNVVRFHGTEIWIQRCRYLEVR